MAIHCDSSLHSHLMIIPRPQIEAILSDAGLEMSPQRFAILECLARSDEHPTVDEILEKLQRLYPRPSRDSVQRTLQTLCDSGLTCAETYHDQSIHYRLRFDPLDPPLPSELEDD